MKSSLSLLASAATFASVCTANFDLYSNIATYYNGPGFTQVQRQWSIHEAEASCSDATGAHIYFQEEDVSSGQGVRCEGGGCDPMGNADEISELEMNLGFPGESYHWTIYRDRPRGQNGGYLMYGLDGNTYGECIVYPGHRDTCNEPFLILNISRKFRCLTEVTVDQIMP